MLQPADQIFEAYLRELHKVYGLGGDATEHSGRTALHTLLRAFAAEGNVGLTVTHEPKKATDKGAPDFKVTKAGMILGYVENKSPGTPLKPVIESEQVAKYKQLSDNLLITDYLQFARISGGKVVARATLVHADELDNPKVAARADKAAEVAGILRAFFSVAPEGIARAAVLAEALAVRSRLLRDALAQELIRQQREHEEGRLFGLYRAFQSQIFAELKLKEFADAFAQTLAYGLFLAKLNADAIQVNLENANKYVPASFGLIRELVDFLKELEKDEYADVRWVLNEILSIINGLKLADLHEDLSFRNRKIRRGIRAKSEEEARLFERDPFVFFYEDYLARYDPATRKARGVYYTPPPVVNFIVRAIDDLLTQEFNIAGGLADHRRVTLLDFACGTGTFLIEVLERIRERSSASYAKLRLIVREHILINLYGFEYLIAPYTIAHLKLSQYLRDCYNYVLKDGERLAIYLTNTLEPVEPQKNFLLPQLTREVEQAQRVKDNQVLVITGNPPYNKFTRNKGAWITSLLNTYRHIDGVKVEEGTTWISDDYVKFIRFAQWKMEQVTQGIVGIITNHSFLDNPTFRGMRYSLMQEFDQIWVIDLHGNRKKEWLAPDGSKDENIFDIDQGVAISIFVKRPGAERGVWRADLWGSRLGKYHAALEGSMSTLSWTRITPLPPFLMFVKYDAANWATYRENWSVKDIFVTGGTGIITKRDKLAIHFDRQHVWEVVKRLASCTERAAREEFGLPDDVRDWRVEWAKEDLIRSGPSRENIRRVLYRPFDDRYTYYTGRSRGFLGWPVPKLAFHMGKGRVGLITSRMTKGEQFAHAIVSSEVSEVIVLSSKTSNNGFLFPLYLYKEPGDSESDNLQLFETGVGNDASISEENFSKKFRQWIDGRYESHYEAEEILGYVYAVLYANVYRQSFAEFLRTDFPRIPFPEKAAAFEQLSRLGLELVEAHLMRRWPDAALGRYRGDGDNMVREVRYVEAHEAVYINNEQRFAPIPPEVWDFHIGGYPVLRTYLKYRKGRTHPFGPKKDQDWPLMLDEIENVENVANILAFTVEQMKAIDQTYIAAFPA